jgi:hypothetical protein
MSDDPTTEKNYGWDYRESPDLPPSLPRTSPAPGKPSSVGLTDEQVADNFGTRSEAEQRIERANGGQMTAEQWREILEAPRAPSSRATPVDEFDDWDEFHASETEPHTLGPISNITTIELSQGITESYGWTHTPAELVRERELMNAENETAPAALPAPGETSTPERTDVHAPDLSGANLTVKQVAQSYVISERTIMAKLKAGTVPGAQKVPGPNGEQWLIPTAAAAQLWKPRTDAPGVAAAAQPDQSQLLREFIEKQSELHAELRTEIAALRSQLIELKQITHRALTAAPVEEMSSMPAPAHRARWWKRTK